MMVVVFDFAAFIMMSAMVAAADAQATGPDLDIQAPAVSVTPTLVMVSVTPTLVMMSVTPTLVMMSFTPTAMAVPMVIVMPVVMMPALGLGRRDKPAGQGKAGNEPENHPLHHHPPAS